MKFVVYFIMFLGIIGLGYGVYYTTGIDDANKELTSMQQQTGMLETHIKNQVDYLELRKEVSALLTVNGIMQKEADGLRNEIAASRARESQARRDFDQAVLKARENSAGLEVGSAVLPSGVRLQNARVQKVEGDITTVLHSEGISKLSPDMLPLELKERFRFGMPMGGAEEVEPVASKSTASTSTASPAAVPQKDSLKEVGAKLAKFQKELPYLEEELTKAQAEATNAASPSKRFYAKNRLDAVTQQVADLKAQIAAAELEAKKLASEQ